MDLLKGRLGLPVGRLLVGALQLPAPRPALGFEEMADDVFSLVPLTALDEGSVSEDLPDGLVKAAGSVGDRKDSLVEGKAPVD